MRADHQLFESWGYQRHAPRPEYTKSRLSFGQTRGCGGHPRAATTLKNVATSCRDTTAITCITIASVSRPRRTGSFKIFFGFPLFFFVGQTWLKSGVPSCLEGEEDKKKAHHNLVCRIEPMQSTPKWTCVCSKTPDQTRPDQSHKSTNQPSRNLISFLI